MNINSLRKRLQDLLSGGEQAAAHAVQTVAHNFSNPNPSPRPFNPTPNIPQRQPINWGQVAHNFNNSQAYNQKAPVFNPFIPSSQPIANVSPKQIVDFGVNFTRDTLRQGAEAGLTATHGKAYNPADYHNDLGPVRIPQTFVFGNETLRPYDDPNRPSQQFAKKLPISADAQKKVGAGIPALLLGSNFLGGESAVGKQGAKVVGENVVKTALKETPSALKAAKLNDTTKALYSLFRGAQTPQEALQTVKTYLNDAIGKGDQETFQALKKAAAQYKSDLVTGPGKPRDPMNEPIIAELDKVLGQTINGVKANFQQVTNIAKQAKNYQQSFQAAVDEIAHSQGVVAEHGPVKTVERAIQKAVHEKGGDLSSIQDWNRSFIPVNAPEDVNKFLDVIKSKFGDPVNIKNNFTDATGAYKKILVNVTTPEGHTAEIQFTTPEMWRAKMELGGDKLYNQVRLQQGDWQAITMKMNKLYSDAEGASAARLKSSAETGVPSPDALAGGNGVPEAVMPNTSPVEGSASTLTSVPSTLKNNGKFSIDTGRIPLKQPVVNTIPGDVRSAIAGRIPIKERGFVTSIKESANAPEKVKKMIEGSYVVKSTNQLRKDAAALWQAAPEKAFEIASNPTSDVHIQLGNELLNHLAAIGDTKNYRALGESMANAGTEFGRAVQAFANYDKTSPAGVIRWAQSKVNEYNKLNPGARLKITDPQVENFFKTARKIQNMPMGKARNIAANDLMNEVNNLIPSGIGDKGITLWKAFLLTSLRTHERNLIGNTIHHVAEIAKDVPASMVDQALSLRTGQRTLTATVRGVGSGTKKGLEAGKDIITRGYDPEAAIEKFDIKHVTWGSNKVEQGLKHFTDAVFRTLGAEDKPFWHSSFARSLYDQAQTAAINAGKSGDAKFIEKLVKKPTSEMLGIATRDANVATFHNPTQIGEALKKVQNFKVEGVPIGQVIAPFTGVPSSIGTQFFAYSPFGLLKGLNTARKVAMHDLPELQRQASHEIGRGVIGSGILGIGAYLAGQKLLTGQPKDANEARQWQLEGKQGNSVFLGGKWRSINSIGPEGLVLLAGLRMYQLAQAKDDKSAMLIASGMLNDALNQTSLQGVEGGLNAINDPVRYANQYLKNLAGSTVPNFIGDIAKATDNTSRETNNVVDAVKNRIPIVRQSLLPNRDALGNPVKQEPTGVGAFIDLFNSKTPVNNDAVINELGRLNNSGNNATPSKITKNQTINGVPMNLTPEQLNVLESEVGYQAKLALTNLFAAPGYQALSDQDKAAAVDSVMTQVRKQVRGTVDVNQQVSNNYQEPATSNGGASNPPISAQSPSNNGGSIQPVAGDPNKFTIVDPDTGNIKTIDLNQLTSAKSGIAAFKQKDDLYKLASQVFSPDTNLTEQQKNYIYQKLGVTKADAEYQYKASLNDDVKAGYFIDKAQDQDHQWILDRLLSGRTESIRGDLFASDGVVNAVRDAGLISNDEAKAIKAVKVSKTGQNIGSSAYKKGKKLKIASPKKLSVKLAKAPKIKAGKTLKFNKIALRKSGSSSKNIKLKKPNINPSLILKKA